MDSSRAENTHSRHVRRWRNQFLLAASLLVLQASAAWASQPSEIKTAADLRNLSIDQLADVEIYSVSKTRESLNDAAASVYVISHEDIIRSGAITVPEILRLAPNLEVAQINANSYAISARGFSSSTANKLLVLIDGRSVYTPLYSGVFWDVQNVMPEDIERIEVISGPGATLWGPNAVNGVINIITKNSRDTQGGVVHAQGGNADSILSARYGDKVGEYGNVRVYFNGLQRENTLNAAGIRASDAWNNLQTGFRSDWTKEQDSVTFQGDIYSGALQQVANGDEVTAGGNLIGRWNRTISETSALQLQLYYDYSERYIPRGAGDKISVYDASLQHSFALGEDQSFVWGGGFRVSKDQFRNASTSSGAIIPAKRTMWLGNAFVQDNIALTDSLKLILGIQLEANSYTGIEPLPTARLAWKVDDANFLWAAVSRAVRTPSRIDRDVYSFVGPVTFIGGGPGFEDEKLTAYELGYRSQLSSRASLSVSTYYNVYDDMRTLELSPTGLFSVTISGVSGYLPIVFENNMEGETYGVEVWGKYQATDWWTLSAGFNAIHKNLRLKPGSLDIGGIAAAGNDPDTQFQLRSSMNLLHDIKLDLALRSVSEVPNPHADGYVTVDARIAWNLLDNLEVSLTGFNLIDHYHFEDGLAADGTQVGRNISLGVRWIF